MNDRPDPPAITLEPLLDLQRLVAGVRWRRRLWTTLALAGLLLGLVFSVLAPAGSTATAGLYVVHEDEEAGDRETLMKTDVAVLETTQVAGAALALLGITDERPEDFVRDYAGESTAANVLEITVSGAGRADAVRRAQALADAFIGVHVQRVEDSAAAESRALLDRRAQAEDDLAALNEEIARGPVVTPGAGPEDAATQLSALYAQRSALGSQIQELAQRAEDAAVGAPRVAAGTQIIDAPRVTSRSAVVSAAINGVLGLFVGLAGGLVLAAVVSVVADRPVLRRDITAHLGASVIAQLPAPHRGPSRIWRRSRPVVERRRVAETLARVVAGSPAGVSLLEIGCPGPAADLALDTVTNLSRERPVALVDDLPGQPVGAAAGRSDGPVRLVGGPDDLHPGGGDGDDGPAPERLVGVGSVVPGTAWTDLPRLGAETVLIVRAGHADTTWLHTVARQLADLEIVVIGVVLVHPDPRDRSDGTLWDGLHTALRGRARPGAPVEVPPQAPATVVEGTASPAAVGVPGPAVRADTRDEDTPPAAERVVDPVAPAAAERSTEEPVPAGTTATGPPEVSATLAALAALRALGVSTEREPAAGGPASSGTVPPRRRPSPVPRNGHAERNGRTNGSAHGRNNGTPSTQEVS